ncbi:MAG: 4-alpha-glucanotransferase [unclassified Hahellaceae]|nr:4-alpha-glucanotransferase [Hahellaceae bacterium]
MDTSPRRSGILLHPSSLPSADGIGNIGAASQEFIRQLASAGQSVWQMLPVGPPDAVGSPYSSTSAMAGDPALIDTAELHDLSSEGRPSFKERASDIHVSRRLKQRLLQRSFQEFRKNKGNLKALETFKAQEEAWLDDYALFHALADHYGTVRWYDWPQDLAQRDPVALRTAKQSFTEQHEFWCFCQYEFDRQWSELRACAHDHKVELVGDAPIYVGYESCDVWANPELFSLDPNTRAIKSYAGVPPDDFFGGEPQNWGMPTYEWSNHAADRYQWWVSRIRRLTSLFDLIRVDHFRALESFWSISDPSKPGDGAWIEGPGQAFFDAIYDALGPIRLIAEDIGIITEAVDKLRLDNKIPGIRVLQYGFGLDLSPNNHLPEAVDDNAVVYTGTHDTDTTMGWYDSLSDEKRQFLERYWQDSQSDMDLSPPWRLMLTAMRTRAHTVVIPMQDVLNLGSEARMNLPGVVNETNWSWRMEAPMTEAVINALKALTRTAGRLRASTSEV